MPDWTSEDESNANSRFGPTTHIYRDPWVAKSNIKFLVGFVIVSIGLLLVVTGGWRDLGGAAFLLVPALAVVCLIYFFNPIYRGRSCREIRLSEDGTCEFETNRRGVIRLHVNEIQAVTGRRGEDWEWYTIRYPSGKITVNDRMAGFDDFLRRLKALNPAVDVSPFRLDTSGDIGRPDKRRSSIVSFLFPLVVICLLVYLADKTLI
jgi:hypothetical protein